MQKMQVWSLGQEDPLEEKMTTHTRIPTWNIPWIDEPSGLQSKGSQRVRHDLVTKQQQQQWQYILFLGKCYFQNLLYNRSHTIEIIN